MDTNQLLKEALIEIESLQNANEKLRLRIKMFDDIMLLLNINPNFHGMINARYGIVEKIKEHFDDVSKTEEYNSDISKVVNEKYNKISPQIKQYPLNHEETTDIKNINR